MSDAALSIPLKQRLAARGLDSLTLLVVPAVLFLLLLFIYPFFYGLFLSFNPKEGGALANYRRFFSRLLPVRHDLHHALARHAGHDRDASAGDPRRLPRKADEASAPADHDPGDPDHAGTVLVAQGLLNYLGPQGWFNRTLMTIGLIDSPVKLIHNYWGVMLSLVITGFPFTFLLTLSYLTGVDPGAGAGRRDARRRSLAAFQAHPPPAAAARSRHHLLPELRPGLSRYSPRQCCSALRPGPPALSRSRPIRRPSRNTTTRWHPPSR